MPNYNTQGITSSAGSDPRNLGGSEGYGNPTASTSSGLMSSTANATTNNDDNDDEPGFFESIANLFSGAGADLPSDKSDDDGDSGISFYDSPMFTPYDGGSDNDTTPQGGLPFETTAADRALYEALGVDVPEVYKGKMPEEEPEPNLDMDVLQKALQPEPITVEELEVKAGDTLTAIAEEKGLPVQAVIDANPQIKNPDLIRPGEVVSLPAAQAEIGQARASIMSAQQEIGQARAAIIMKGIDKLFGMFPPKTKEEKAAKSELEYFLDAQPDSALPDFFKYVPDAVQVQEYLKGRADRRIEGLARESAELAASERDAAGITRSLTPEEVAARNNVAGTDPRELGGAEGYGSVGIMSDPRKLDGAEGYGKLTKGSNANVDFDFIKKREGFEKDVYVPKGKDGKVLGKSGATVASGFDLGQRNEADLKGLPSALVTKLKPYLGKKGAAANTYVTNNPLSLTEAEANTINTFAKKQEIDRVKEDWDNSSSTKDFKELTKEQATVVASVAFQYGDLPTKTPTFWKHVTAGDWDKAEAELRSFGDAYSTRRKLEADYLAGN
jgi:LysM repeat protein/GH24 family phage-related lysozyme (muramidase)